MGDWMLGNGRGVASHVLGYGYIYGKVTIYGLAISLLKGS